MASGSTNVMTHGLNSVTALELRLITNILSKLSAIDLLRNSDDVLTGLSGHDEHLMGA